MSGHPHAAMWTNHGMSARDRHGRLSRSLRDPSMFIISKPARGIKIGPEYRDKMGMVQNHRFSGNSMGLSADRDRLH
jgi:hypothetical protein